MNEQNNIQEPNKKKSSTVKVVAITTLTTALLVGGSVYVWQKSVQKSLIKKYELTKTKSQQQNEQPEAQMAEQKTEQKQDTSTLIISNWKTYTEPNEYSIQYPSHWYLRGRGGNLGNEILQLWNYDIEKVAVSNGHGLPPNPAKVALSIRMKDSKSLEEIVNAHSQEYEGALGKKEAAYQTEKLTVNGQPAVRIYYTVDGDTTIDIFLDYKEDKYASIIGYLWRGPGSDIALKEIKQIQESFKIIQ